MNLDSGLVMATNPTTSAVLTTGGFDPITDQVDNDPDIEMIGNGNAYTCAVLEFDVLVNADALAFDYLFSSTEYQSFTCSGFNDAFGFFVSGPGIAGSFTNGAINIATIPDSEIPIAINTVNSGSTANGNESNCLNANPNWQNDTIYFVQNINNQNSSIIMNGYTVGLEALIEVVNGESYHMKLAICNILDGSLQSAVFLGAGSFEGRLLGPTNTNNININELKIYPNPATDRVFLENICAQCTGQVQIKIQDLQGRVVSESTHGAASLLEISTSDLNNGIYILSAWNGNVLIGTSKIIRN